MMTINEAAGSAAAKTQLPVRSIFLTGGSGYVGRNLIRHFAGMGVAVVALARSQRSMEIVSGLGAQPFSATSSAAT